MIQASTVDQKKYNLKPPQPICLAQLCHKILELLDDKHLAPLCLYQPLHLLIPFLAFACVV